MECGVCGGRRQTAQKLLPLTYTRVMQATVNVAMIIACVTWGRGKLSLGHRLTWSL
jgi:hypothetical protein